MADKRLSIVVRGREKRWSFQFLGDPKHLAEWRADGLEVYEVVHVIPAWVASLGLVRPWCFLQSVLNFRNPFGR